MTLSVSGPRGKGLTLKPGSLAQRSMHLSQCILPQDASKRNHGRIVIHLSRVSVPDAGKPRARPFPDGLPPDLPNVCCTCYIIDCTVARKPSTRRASDMLKY